MPCISQQYRPQVFGLLQSAITSAIAALIAPQRDGDQRIHAHLGHYLVNDLAEHDSSGAADSAPRAASDRFHRATRGLHRRRQTDTLYRQRPTQDVSRLAQMLRARSHSIAINLHLQFRRRVLPFRP